MLPQRSRSPTRCPPRLTAAASSTRPSPPPSSSPWSAATAWATRREQSTFCAPTACPLTSSRWGGGPEGCWGAGWRRWQSVPALGGKAALTCLGWPPRRMPGRMLPLSAEQRQLATWAVSPMCNPTCPCPWPAPLPCPCVQSPIRQVGPTFLSDRTPVISPEQSAALVGAMRGIGMVDADGWLLGDPDTNKPASLVRGLVCGVCVLPVQAHPDTNKPASLVRGVVCCTGQHTHTHCPPGWAARHTPTISGGQCVFVCVCAALCKQAQAKGAVSMQASGGGGWGVCLLAGLGASAPAKLAGRQSVCGAAGEAQTIVGRQLLEGSTLAPAAGSWQRRGQRGSAPAGKPLAAAERQA